MHLITGRTLFDYIVSSFFETTSLSRPSSPLALSPVVFFPTWTCWMELSSLVVAAPFEAGRGTYIQDWSWDHSVDCWHNPRFVALGLTSRMVIVVSLERTARRNSQLCVIILSAFSFIVAWFCPVASHQPGPQRLKVKHCWKFGYNDTRCTVLVL